ncbi:di-trans,poly-cis-decaprenylcistransferase [Candidatus Saganbacteria bacterium]|nr:di-trans,poly-cis-decaprenylcistransferase [Candidatus Saganbacteria bacterium]
MDGNGRWAKKKGLPRIAGHKVGADSLKEAVKTCAEAGVKHLTVYAFSTENWKRPKEEVGFLMTLFSQTLDREVAELEKNNVRLRFLGRLQDFSPELQKKMKAAMERLSKNTGLNLNVMVSYGGRAEIVDAILEMRKDEVPNDEINEETVGKYLYTKDVPDPDLLIRTASEMRVSNFLLWQIAYAEIYVTEVLWPDFRKKELLAAIVDYSKRERRFGKTSEQIK